MENKEFQFKTNLNCGGCVSKVQTDLDKVAGVGQWDVDINHDDKILSIYSENNPVEEVLSIVKAKGFNIEPVA
jgi:copper chaperone